MSPQRQQGRTSALAGAAGSGGDPMSRSRLTVLCLLVGLAGCMEGQKADPLLRSPLAERLGGRDKVRVIVADFLALAKEDPGLKPDLKRHLEENPEELKGQLVDLIARPSGAADRQTHGRPRLTPDDFAALANDLDRALRKN